MQLNNNNNTMKKKFDENDYSKGLNDYFIANYRISILYIYWIHT